MRSPRAAVVLLLSLLAVAGCGSACQDLAERICACQPVGNLRDACNASVKSEIGTQSPTDADQTFCQAKLATCPDPTNDQTKCDALQTPTGKAACGLSY